MTTNCHGWRFRALIACRPASIICLSFSSSTGWAANARCTFLVVIASITSIGVLQKWYSRHAGGGQASTHHPERYGAKPLHRIIYRKKYG
jgi:hypothetical protein